MDAKKVFIVVLILLAVLFAVGVVLVAARSEDRTTEKTHQPGGFETSMSRLFGSLEPRAKLGVPSFAAGEERTIGRSDDPMRTLKLRLAKGCRIRITYRRGPHSGEKSDLDEQRWPEDDVKDKESTSFVILEEGGVIDSDACTTSGHSGCRVFGVED
jgi:hypothetical protein